MSFLITLALLEEPKDAFADDFDDDVNPEIDDLDARPDGRAPTSNERNADMADISEWDVENEEFWETEGKKVANRNLWISIPSLLCGFAVWLYWSVITVQMLNLGFPFEQSELFTITAIAGFTGATFRIPNSFFIRIAGGRNTIFLTTRC